MKGRVYQVNVKAKTPGEHGLPKQPVASAWATRHGFAGDHNNYREEVLKGDTDQALLIVPIEVMRELNSEGWPIQPGDFGENITTEGIPYEEFVPGLRYKIGGAVVQISKPCAPCTRLYSLPYVGPDKGPTFLKTTLNRRGWYARVLSEGEIRKSDEIEDIDGDSA